MGNHLRDFLACSFLEFLESNPFKYRLHINTTYFRYTDDILIFLLQNIKIEYIAEKLNNVEPSINFSYEKVSNNTIPIFDVLLIRSQNDLTFQVYCKPSHYNNKIKTGFIIVFFICVHLVYVINNT